MPTERVLHVIHNLEREGAQIVVRNLVSHFDASRVRPLVCAWRRGGAVASELQGLGVPVFIPPALVRNGRLAVPLYIARLIARHDVGIVHAHMSDSAVWTMAAGALTGRPFVITHHSNRLVPLVNPLARQARTRLLRMAARRAAVNIAVSQEVAAHIMNELAVGAAKIRVIPNGISLPQGDRVDEAMAARRARWRTGFGQGRPHIVAVGRLIETKGQGRLISAMPRILEGFPRARITVVGDGPSMARLVNQASELGVAQSVGFTGSIEDVSSVLADADVFVSMSRYEGLPLALLEAMAWGLPVVATDVPGHRDVVANDRTGLLVPYDEQDALSGNVTRLFADGALAAALGAHARDHAATHGGDVMARRYEATYRTLLSKRR